MNRLAVVLALGLGLAACGEKPQTQLGSKVDASAHTGTGSAFVTGTWKQGDKTSWEQQMRARTQNTQNEYSRSSTN